MALDGSARRRCPGATRSAARSGRKRQQLLALIISSKPREIADRVHADMRAVSRRCTAWVCTRRQEREVLMVAVTTTELAHLKALVRAADPNAFIIVSPAAGNSRAWLSGT
ncbi:hypothetical protein EMGBS3_12680 [Anaerolineaceae bacterium]|nr:hypothetical protein EMGBS3_12680 [Anaerolineaceae bacterium]